MFNFIVFLDLVTSPVHSVLQSFSDALQILWTREPI